ncbi:MAG: cytochrome P450, partial [Actinobacteria bacterium]|nr:cytochrome P450 [Actinomycetota bacterium]
DITLNGVHIKAGESVMALPWYGNRDSRYFPNPNVFDIERASKTPHLTFGFGPHFCLGAALGKMQVELSLATLARRLPNLAPAIPLDELPWRHDRINMGIAKFPVTW